MNYIINKVIKLLLKKLIINHKLYFNITRIYTLFKDRGYSMSV